MGKIGVIFIALLFLCFLILFFLGPPSFISKIDTEYTKDFSYTKLNVVQEGDTDKRVLDVLGNPFYGYVEHDDCWYYSRAKSSLSDFLGWEAITVCFNENIVRGVGKNIFFN